MLLCPSFAYISLCYWPLYYIALIWHSWKYQLDRKQLVFGAYISIISLVLWFIFQRRELKRFYERAEVEAKERKAVEKEIELTNVLNLQQNVIVIVSEEEQAIQCDDSAQPRSDQPTVEFSNL